MRCSDAPAAQCRGYIQAAYTSDPYALLFYRSFGLGGELEPRTVRERELSQLSGQPELDWGWLSASCLRWLVSLMMWSFMALLRLH